MSEDGNLSSYISISSSSKQVMLKNFTSGQLTVASSDAGGTVGNDDSPWGVISPNGHWLLFASDATNFVPGVTSDGTGNAPNLFRKNLMTGAVTLAVPTDGQPNGYMNPGAISDDGNMIAFTSSASNMVGAGPSPVPISAYLRDIVAGTVRQLLYERPGSPPLGSLDARISADGRTAAFIAQVDDTSTDVVSCDLSGLPDRAPVCSSVGSAVSVFDLHLAASGTAIEYSAVSSPESDNWQVYRVTLPGGTPEIVSLNDAGESANQHTGNGRGLQGISGDGSTIYFTSGATNLDPEATDGAMHAYLRASPPPTPSGDAIAPVVTMVAPAAASSSDPLLVREFRVNASDEAGGSGLDHLEYAWGQGLNAPEGATPNRAAATSTVPISFADAGPNGMWNLFVRAVDKAGNVGSWFKYGTKTPPKPILVALGDSILSGHHLAGTDRTKICDDPNYSYASDLALRLQQSLPKQWRSPAGPFDGRGSNGYHNYAHSGFSTSKMRNGGLSACKDRKPASVSQAARVLRQHRGAWNQVIVSAGINDTNWEDYVAGPIAASIWAKRLLGVFFTPEACSVVMQSTWNGYNAAVSSVITSNVRSIVSTLHGQIGGDPLAKISWTGYYDISGTGPLDAICHVGVVAAMNRLSHDVRAGLSPAVNWVDINGAMGRRGDLMQPFFDILIRSRRDLLLGWPHPLSPGGTDAISAVFAFS